MRRFRRVGPWIPAGLALALLACGRERPSDAPPARTYQVRGEVVALPDLARGRPDLLVRHEAIPDFLTYEGRLETMDAMTMPFALADGVDLGGLTAGTPIEMTLVVDWGARVPIEVTALRRLP